MKKWSTLVVFFLLSFNNLVVKAEEFRIVTENFPPYNYKDSDSIRGFSTSIVKTMLEMLKTSPKNGIEVMPWVRAFETARLKKNVLIYSMGRNPKRENLFHWIGPIAPSKYFLFSLKGNKNINIEKLADAKKYRIGTVREDVREQYLLSKGFVKGKNIFPTSTYFSSFLKLRANRIDLWAMNEMVAFHLLKEKGYNPNSLLKRSFFFENLSKKGLYMAFNKKSSIQLVKRFQGAFSKMKKNGKYDELRKAFFK
ncbi:MAG: amino acid ABC transporter substrate-binding protein [Halobacteriovoraceae bacterium]|nr:amino acid ABC transporter substrate-binding protein [Halobacteriovoraceae bacterium]